MVIAATNLITNPSVEVDTSTYGGGNATVSRVTTWAAAGAASLQVASTGVSSDNFSHVGGDIGAIRLGMQAGKTYTVSGTINTPVAQTGALHDRARRIVAFYKAGAGYVEAWSSQGPPTGSARVSATFTLPANTTEAFIRLYNGSPTNGEVVQWDAVLLEEGSTASAYFDGDTADGALNTYEWTGTPHASTSTHTVRDITVASGPTVAVTARGSRRGWRYFATRLNGNGTETTLDMDLPLENVTIEDVLSGHGSIQGTLDPVYKRMLAADGEPLLREWSTAIYAENDGDIRAGAILTSSSFDGPEWQIEATGFTGYAVDMPYTGSGYKGIHVDPIDCMRTIWTHIQAQQGGNIGLTLDTTTTGGKVDIGTEVRSVALASESGPLKWESGPYKLNWYSNHDLAGDIDDLANDTPFDYFEKHSWNADGTIKHFVEIGYPKIGRRRTDLRFNYGVNIFDPVQFERDGSIYASGTMVLGAGDGAAMIKSIQEPPTRPGNRLRRIAVVVDDRIRSDKRAAARARAENQWRAQIDDVDSVVVQDHPNARLGAAKVGDEIRIEGQGDWRGIDMWVRILAISYEPADGNVAEYTIARTDKLTS